MDIVQGAWDSSDLLNLNLQLAGKLAKVHDHLHMWDKLVLKRTKKILEENTT
jgi:hypothetical protein